VGGLTTLHFLLELLPLRWHDLLAADVDRRGLLVLALGGVVVVSIHLLHHPVLIICALARLVGRIVHHTIHLARRRGLLAHLS